MGELIAFRALQGLGAGGLMVGAQAIIADIVPPRDRGRYMGLIGSVFAVASVAGPLLGGFFVETLSWRWVFYVNLPIGVIAVLVVVFRLHLHTPTQRHAIDYLGAALLTAGVSALILAHHLGRQRVRVGLARRSSGSAVAGVVLLGAVRRAGAPRRRADHPAQAVPLARVQRRVLDRLRDRPGDVRRDHLHPALPAARLRRQPDELRPADAAADGRPARRQHPLAAARSAASAATSRSRSPAPRSPRVGMFLLSRLEVDTPPWLASVYMLVRRRRHRPRDAGARARRPERRAAARHRRRHLDRDVLPLDGRLARRRAVRRDLRRRAWRTSSSALPPAIAARFSGGVNISPDAVHACPPSRHDFLLAFVDALSPVFLVGAGADRGRLRARLVPARGAAARRAQALAELGRRGSDRGRHRRRGDHRARIVAATVRRAPPALSTTSTFRVRRAALRPAALSRTVMRRVPEPRP